MQALAIVLVIYYFVFVLLLLHFSTVISVNQVESGTISFLLSSNDQIVKEVFMKKILIIFVCLSVALMASACGSASTSASGTEEPPVTESLNGPAALSEPLSGNTENSLPAEAVDYLFSSGDIALTLHLMNYGAHNAYSAGSWYAGRFKALLDSYQWKELEMPSTEPSEFWLTAVSADGSTSMTFWSDRGAGMVQFDDGSSSVFWKASCDFNGSIASDIRFEYDNLDVDYSRITFVHDGSAEEAASYFVHNAYGSHMTSLAPGSAYGLKDFEVVAFNVKEISSDGKSVVGSFGCAFVPDNYDSDAIWAGNTHEGTDEYEGKLIFSREFVLQMQDDGCWHCTDLGTGGAVLP